MQRLVATTRARAALALLVVAGVAWALGHGLISLQALGLSGVAFGLTWLTPKTWTSVVVTVPDLNTYIRDQFLALLGPLTLYVDAGALRPDLSTGCDAPIDQAGTAGRPMVMGAGFSGTADQYAQFKLPLPKAWNAGTVTWRARWSAVSAGAGSVVWSLAAVAASDGDSIDTAFGTAQTVTDAFQSVSLEHVSPTSSALTAGATPAKQDTLYFRVGRLATNGSDTKVEKVYLLGIEIFVTLDAGNDG